MNLGIEYLVRNGAIRNFLETPCCLFLDSDEDEVGKILCLRDVADRPDLYLVGLWDLGRLADDGLLPGCDESEVPKDRVFDSPATVVPGYTPIPYAEQPVVTGNNAYNRPMDRLDYSYFVTNYLNSGRHKVAKADWLWRHFVHMAFDGPLFDVMFEPDFWERRSLVEKEQTYVRTRFKHRWFQWLAWKTEFLLSEEAAPELVFQSAYESRWFT